MQSLDLVNNTHGPHPHYNGVQLLKPSELFYVRIKSLKDMTEEEISVVLKGIKISSEVIVSIPVEEFETEAVNRDKFLNLGLRGFALRVTHNVPKWLKQVGQGSNHSGDRDIIEQMVRFKHIIPAEKIIVPEFQVGMDVRVLGGTIAGLYEHGYRFMVVNPEGEPTRERSAQFRDVFDFLKMRNCNHLNVYFPFWKVNYGEWDIRTQNTFAGLELVHIDISNRCTHSCVFCGLYGPDAIEDIKKKGGGKIPEQINKFMKMEIDSDKAFKIIESLPWSVRQVQFGGFGDPLMHENAVNFIANVRKRGFAAEVLSNMEYLDQDDIERLHKLGGTRDTDLHFIANISAGDAELYVKTRPKQTGLNFQKIVNNLTTFTELRKANNNSGVFFTIMCVVNKVNCHDLVGVAELAVKTGASKIWFKPMEIHGEVHELYKPSADLMKGMAKQLVEAIKIADENKIYLFQRDYCEEIIKRYSGDTVNV